MNPEEQAELNVSIDYFINFEGFNGYKVKNEVYELCSSDDIGSYRSRRVCETKETGAVL